MLAVVATVAPVLLAVAMVAVAAVVAVPVVVQQQAAVAAMVRAAAVPVPAAVVARVAAHALAARLLHAAAPVAVEVAATKAATATMTRNPHAPTPTWARTWATPTRATAVPAMQVAASLTQCAPVWTAWVAAVAVVAVVIVAATEEVAAMAVDQVRVAVVAGATGLVGRAVLAALLTAEATPPKDGGASAATVAAASPPLSSGSQGTAAVHVLHARNRRPPALSHPRLQLHAVDFADLPNLPPVDDVYITLGTTIAAAGSQSAFRAVDYDAVLATARAARAAGASRCGVVTAMGANAQSRIFYNRIKGEVERDLQGLGFATLVIARPSLMTGERQALQQAARPAESLSIQLFKWLDPVIPANYRARPGADVGRALVHAVQSGTAGLHVLSGHALQPH